MTKEIIYLGEQDYNTVLCLDDDEETTIVKSCKTVEEADTLCNKLNKKYPNGAFDTCTGVEAERCKIPFSTFNF